MELKKRKNELPSPWKLVFFIIYLYNLKSATYRV